MKKEQTKFNKKEYDANYQKKRRQEHKLSRFLVDLEPTQKQLLDTLIKTNGFKTQKEFLLKCIEIMSDDNNPIKNK